LITIFFTMPVLVPTSISDRVFEAVGELEQAANDTSARASSECINVFMGILLGKMK